MKDYEQREDNLGEEIRESLDFLDTHIDIKTPDISAFRSLIAQVEEKKQRRARRDTLLFLVSAVTILFVEVYSFSRSFAFFAAVQTLALLCLPVVLLSLWRKKKKGQVVS